MPTIVGPLPEATRSFTSEIKYDETPYMEAVKYALENGGATIQLGEGEGERATKFRIGRAMRHFEELQGMQSKWVEADEGFLSFKFKKRYVPKASANGNGSEPAESQYARRKRLAAEKAAAVAAESEEDVD